MEPEDRGEAALGSRDPGPREGGQEAGSGEARLGVLWLRRETQKGGDKWAHVRRLPCVRCCAQCLRFDLRDYVRVLVNWCGCLSGRQTLPYSQHLILFRVLHSALQSWAFPRCTHHCDSISLTRSWYRNSHINEFWTMRQKRKSAEGRGIWGKLEKYKKHCLLFC